MTLLGAILAGGRSRRFGSDKALAELDGQPLITHAAAALVDFVNRVVVCGRESPISGVASVADWPEPDLGPLGGLCGALRLAADHGYAAVVSIGCDTPTIPWSVLARLCAVDGAAFLPQLPVIGRWPSDLAALLGSRLSGNDDRSVRGFAAAIGAMPIDAEDIPNLNRPEDLARLRAATNA